MNPSPLHLNHQLWAVILRLAFNRLSTSRTTETNHSRVKTTNRPETSIKKHSDYFNQTRLLEPLRPNALKWQNSVPIYCSTLAHVSSVNKSGKKQNLSTMKPSSSIRIILRPFIRELWQDMNFKNTNRPWRISSKPLVSTRPTNKFTILMKRFWWNTMRT